MKDKIKQLIRDVAKENQVFNFVYNKDRKFNTEKDWVYYSGPYWDNEEVVNMFSAVLTGKWLSAGEHVHKFENEFSKKFNLSASLMVNSGSSANLVMFTALKSHLKWSDGDEVILSPVGFPTTIAPLYQNRLVPVFVDISMDDLNFDLQLIEAKITAKTRAIVVSPVLGNAPNMDTLLALCEKRDIRLIMDNCDSLGSRWDNKLLTDYSFASSCSFYPAHHITTGEGGMVSSNDKDFVKVARRIAWWGRDCYCVGSANLLPSGTCGNRFDKWVEDSDAIIDHKYYFTEMGYNLKPLDLQGAIGLAQLEKYDEIHAKRRNSKQTLDFLFEKYVPGARTIKEIPKAHTSWFGTPFVCESKNLKRKLVQFLEGNRIQTRNYFAGNILQHPAYKFMDDYLKYPKANRVLEEVFFVGAAPHYTDDTFAYIESVLKKWGG
jgi:CDP-4-dehydro-6-deoxyglucose reductase, E1